ncbi:uncharacterized protein LOC106643221 [Copidosoma floridanum]|uniref:uncharacterized protein LOC106643221 n=1 Tax=Copidosoma floridanum TaxID=29053 RepID=UPI000C6FC705|nr:uncharacterized protein LOC106643221 [Copidosoma floridanum]
MENRPAPLRSRRVCRFCLTDTEPLNFIYDRELSKPSNVPLALQIMSCVGIEVYSADGMPQMICLHCRGNLDRSYKFKQQCKKADEALRAYPISGVLPRPFPLLSSDSSEGTAKRKIEIRSPNDPKKPRLDNGDRDRRENLREKEELQQRHEYYEEPEDMVYEGEHDANAKDDDDESKLEPGEIRVHACNQCERTFPLLQSLQLHMERAHGRDREYKCTECDRSFYSKYDLTKHMTTHNEEKPYSCQICNRQFSRANLLARHEKIHQEELKYSCVHCDRSFFTREDLDKHEENMHTAVKPYQCNICNKQFTYKQSLERHEMLHSEDKSFVCEYCKEAFRTSTKLARHLTTHAGHRPYLCKLCPRSFLLSHHLTRHMRSHLVEKRHQCEDCGKAFKRKESLEVHQLTHIKRPGMGLICNVCKESCRNRADYVTHIKQHIEAGEKMGPDGLPPENKEKLADTEEEEEEEEEEQYSDDDDDDYEPPSSYVYQAKKMQRGVNKSKTAEDEEEETLDQDEENKKEQIVYVRGKDGNVVKKTIKTLMPIQRRSEPAEAVKPKSASTPQVISTKQIKEEGLSQQKGRVDETEAQVQKIVASVFKEHKIPLKNQSAEQIKESQQVKQVTMPTVMKEEKIDSSSASTSQNTVKVIKRIIVKRPAGSDMSGAITGPIRDFIQEPTTPTTSPQQSVATPSTSGTKSTKRYILRRIIRQGNMEREVIMHADGTPVDPAELAKLPAANVVKRLVMKKPVGKNQNIDDLLLESPDTKQLLKLVESQDNAAKSVPTPMTPIRRVEQQPQETSGNSDQSKERIEALEKALKQRDSKIAELEAQNQQHAQQHEYDADEMLPERNDDDDDDEQALPLKRVFVKRKQCIYDEEREYNDDASYRKEGADEEEIATAISSQEESKDKDELSIEDAKIIIIKPEESQHDVDEMSRELCNILDSTDSVVKMQETVLNNLTRITTVNEASSLKTFAEVVEEATTQEESKPEVPTSTMPEEQMDQEIVISSGLEQPHEQVVEEVTEHQDPQLKIIVTHHDLEEAQVEEVKMDYEGSNVETSQTEGVDESENVERSEAELSELNTQVLSDTNDIFEASVTEMEVDKSQEQSNVNESVIELSVANDTINLNETTDSRDSLEDKLSQMEG